MGMDVVYSMDCKRGSGLEGVGRWCQAVVVGSRLYGWTMVLWFGSSVVGVKKMVWLR
jgi:hypothetical protein